VDFAVSQLGLSSTPTVIGMSDWDTLANSLSARDDVEYTNTFYHCAPYIDICEVPPYLREVAHIVICSDVIEHVPYPVENAIVGLSNVIKTGGYLVLSVPYDFRDFTTEHYSDLTNLTVVDVGSEFVVVGRNATNEVQTRANPVFHGGPGTTLEMRFMAWNHVLGATASAGLELVTLAPELEEDGLIWLHDFGRTALFRKTPPTA
jgi:hypothetical protein